MSAAQLPRPTDPTTSVEFSAAARLIASALHEAELVVPSFRSPPQVVGVDRALRRRGGEVMVAVRIRHRAFAPVLADMIEGVVRANQLSSPAADRLRADLWERCGYAADAEPGRHVA